MSPRKEQKEQSQRLRAHRRTGPTPGQGCGGAAAWPAAGRQRAGLGLRGGFPALLCGARELGWARTQGAWVSREGSPSLPAGGYRGAGL